LRAEGFNWGKKARSGREQPDRRNRLAQRAPLPGGIWGSPAYHNDAVYYGGLNDNLKALPIANGRKSYL
jgi:hypothetical protein